MNYTTHQLRTADLFRRALLVGLGAQLIAPVAMAQDSTAPVELEKQQVTGSRLTGAEIEGALSVNKVDLTSPINTGFVNVVDTIRYKLPQVGGTGNSNEGFGNGGSGQAFVGLRGLPGNATLVLVDGRRTSTSDLNLIPQSAIESIEVVNDGAGAVYGTDAVAGVVNIKLRKDFRGTMFTAYYGNTFDTDVGSQSYKMLFGTGDEKTRALFSAEYSRANSLLSPDRQRSFPAGSNVSGTSNPGLLFDKTDFGLHEAVVGGVTNSVANAVALRWTVNHLNSRGLTNASQIPAFTGPVPASVTVTNGGLVGTFPLIVAGGSFDPLARVDTSTAVTPGLATAARNEAERILRTLLPVGAPVRYGGNASLLPGVNPGFPFGYYTISHRPHERYGFNTSISHELFDKNLEVFADAYYMRNQSEYVFAPSPLNGKIMTTDNFWWRQVFPTSAAGTPVNLTYRPVEAGPRIYYDDFQSIHAIAGLRGKIGESSWEWEASYLYDRTQDERTLTGGILADTYAAAINGTTAATAFNPFGYTPIGGTSLVNSQATVDSFRGQAGARDVVDLQIVEGFVRGELFDLPAGAVKVLGGAQRREESQQISPDYALQNELVFPFNQEPAWSGNRRVTAFYAEANVPVLGKDDALGQVVETFDLNGAVRYERFEDIDEDTGVKPRVGFRWTALEQQITLRGSYAQGFTAPTLGDLNQPAFQSFPELYNPLTGIRTQPDDGVYYSPNTALQPEESDNYLFGVRYSPKFVKGLTLGVDYYRIEQSSVIVTPVQAIVDRWFAAGGTGNANNPFGPTATPSAANPTGAKVIIDPATQDITRVTDVAPINTGARLTDGFDLSITQVFETEIGKFTLSGNATRVLTFEMADLPGSADIDYLGRFWGGGASLEDVGFPEWRAVASLEYENERFYAAVAWNFTGGYEEDENGTNYNPALAPSIRDVSSYSTVDLRVRYTVPKVEADITFGVNNVLDEAPPAVYSAFESNVDRQFADLRGRFWFVEVSKKF
jgi:outer membrane receptor protein involved in Fe transport